MSSEVCTRLVVSARGAGKEPVLLSLLPALALRLRVGEARLELLGGGQPLFCSMTSCAWWPQAAAREGVQVGENRRLKTL